MLAPDVARLIHSVRDQRVILDADLARLYGVPTKALNQAVKRNLSRFPADFLFRLNPAESEDLMQSQIVTARPLRSQSVTSNAGRGGMVDISIKNAGAYAARYELRLGKRLGFGIHGSVHVCLRAT
jgi:hypothetical protein